MQACFPDIRILPLTEADVPALQDIWERSLRASLGVLSDDFFARERGALAEIYFRQTVTFVAGGASPVGFVSMLPGGEIAGLFVAPEHQREGVGRLLVRHVQAGSEALSTEVVEPNLRARRFFHAMGFQYTGSRTHPESGEKLLQLQLC